MKFNLSDLGLLAGFAAFCYGLWLAWHPLAFIIGGAAAIVFSVLGERGRAAAAAMASRGRNS